MGNFTMCQKNEQNGQRNRLRCPLILYNYIALAADDFAVLSRGNTVLGFEGAIEAGVVLESDLGTHLLHGNTLADEDLGLDQPPLSQATVEADTHFLAEGLGNGAFTDI